MDLIFLIGRLLFVTIFVGAGIGHFAAKDTMVGYAKSMGAPNPEITVPLSGAMLILGSIMIAFGLWADIGALLVIAFLIPTNYFMHRYWEIDDPEQRQMQQIQFNKNTSLIGAAIVIFYLYNQGQDLPVSLSNALLGRF